jgi:hypothetical protein
MICYQPLARQLCLFLGIIIDIISTFVNTDVFIVWVKLLEELLPFGLMTLVVVTLIVHLPVPLELFSTKKVLAIVPH